MNILIIGLGVSEQLMVLCSKRPVTTLHITFGKEVIKKQLSLPVFTVTVPVS